MNSLKYCTILFSFFSIPFVSFSQVLSTDEKIEMLGLAGQSAEVITTATEADFTLEEIDQANGMKNKGITDTYIVSVMKQHKKLSVTDILKIKEYIDKGYPASAINKSISEKSNFPSATKPAATEKKEEVKPKEEKQMKNYFAFNVGALFPISKFAETNANSNNSGYASTGAAAGFGYQHYFNHYIGLSLTLQFNHNFVNTDEIEKDIKTSLTSDFNLTEYKESGYSLSHLGLGPAFSYPLNASKSLAAELIANGGIVLLYHHGAEYTIVDNSNADVYLAKLPAGNQFTYFFNGTLGLRYLIDEKTYISLHSGYYFSRMDKLKRTAKGYYNSQQVETEVIESSQDIHNISLMLTIGGKF